ncbi:ABC transporter substrate-binding protein, partial [Klebsiella pneumoniae]|uniref:ABC transporter substrate-binding protein n=1 Tax=Klebsiella pneumoniae TaxID=573 RepID=UPI0038BBCB3E
MVGHLQAGRIDGFCAGGPWGALAVDQGQGFTIATSQAICPGWPARASWVMVSTALDRRSIDSGTRAWASSRVACWAC